MVWVDYVEGEGWGEAEVRAYGPITLDPAAAVLHYAQEIFEGLKAYRHADGSVWLFRPEANAERFDQSCDRMALPHLPDGAFVESVRQLVTHRRGLGAVSARDVALRAADDVRQRGVPRRPPGTSGDLRRDRVAGRKLLRRLDEAGRRSGSARSTAGRPPAAPARPSAVRTTPGPCARSRTPTTTGVRRWRSSTPATHSNLEELGGMNIFIVTKERRGGHTRTHRHLPRGHHEVGDPAGRAPTSGWNRPNARSAWPRWSDGLADGTVTEVFASGTAAVLTPIGELKWTGGGTQVAGGEPGRVDCRDSSTPVEHSVRLGRRSARLDDPGGPGRPERAGSTAAPSLAHAV